MRRKLRTIAALIVVLTMVFTWGIVAYADAPVAVNPMYVPLRMLFEYTGSTVTWEEENSRIVVNHEDDTYYFFLHRSDAFKNGEAFTLNFMVAVDNNTSYISWYDIAFVFVDETGYLSDTIMIAVLNALYLMDVAAIPGLTIAIVDAETGFTWTQGFGFADVANNVSVTENTLFNLASISKTFTAVAVMQLAEAGVIDLDEPVVTYLPDFSSLPDFETEEADYRNITVRMLLAHASGLYPDLVASGVATVNSYNKAYMNDFLDTLAGLRMSSTEASVFTYANNSFTLLGILVAEMAGYDSFFDGFVSYMQEKVFTPAGMSLSTFALGSSHMPYLAHPYVNTAVPDDLIYYNAIPAGGVFSNANDMARFMHILLSGGIYEGSRILSADSVQQMFEIQDFEFEHAINYLAPNMHPGLGLIYATGFDGFTHVGHSGNVIHYHSDMAFDLDSGLGVFVSVSSISGMGVDRYLAVEVLQYAVYSKTGALDKPTPDYNVTLLALTPEELAEFEGVYALIGESEFIQVVVAEDGMLYVLNLSGIPFPLVFLPLSDGSFINPDFESRLWFEEIEDILLLFAGDYKTHLIGQKLDVEFYQPDDGFERWIGIYEVQLEEEDHVSIVSHAVIGLDPNGITFIRIYALHGQASISPLMFIEESTYYAGDVLEFEIDGDTVFMTFSGATFVKIS